MIRAELVSDFSKNSNLSFIDSSLKVIEDAGGEAVSLSEKICATIDDELSVFDVDLYVHDNFRFDDTNNWMLDKDQCIKSRCINNTI